MSTFGTGPQRDRTVEIRNVTDVPERWGTPSILTPAHPVKFREPSEGENYSYYGRVAERGIDYIAQRWQGGDKWKDASPVKIDEMKATYDVLPPARRAALGISEGSEIFIKTEPTKVICVPSGYQAMIFTAERSEEIIVGSSESLPVDAIAFDTQGRPYKFPLKKNLSAQGELPPAYSKA